GGTEVIAIAHAPAVHRRRLRPEAVKSGQPAPSSSCLIAASRSGSRRATARQPRIYAVTSNRRSACFQLPLHRHFLRNPAFLERVICRFRRTGPYHHGSGPSSFEKVPVGPSGPRSARRTGSRAACSTVRVPSKLLRSVAVKPGSAALTLMPVGSSSLAKASVTALRAVFDGL